MRISQKIVFLFLCGLVFCLEAEAQVRVGYAIVTPLATQTRPLVGFATYGVSNGIGLTQAAVFPSQVSDSFAIYLSNDPATGKDLGIAVVNPQSVTVNVTFKLKSASGDSIGNPVVISIPPHGHISKFIRQDLFRSE